MAALMEEDWEEAAAAEAVAARVASDTARFLPETTPLLLAAAAKATAAAEVAASSGDSSDEEEMESDARGPPEGVASYDDDYEFGVALPAPVTTLEEVAAAEDPAAVRLQASGRGQRARREVAGRRQRDAGAQSFGTMTVEDEEDESFEDEDEEEEEHAITALRAQALAAAADQGEEGVAMGFLSLRRSASTDEVS